MQRTFRKSRALRFETLERRAMLAGDVTVSVVNHNLVVHSDDGADSSWSASPRPAPSSNHGRQRHDDQWPERGLQGAGN